MGPWLRYALTSSAMIVAACGPAPLAETPDEPSTVAAPSTIAPPQSTAAPNLITTGDLEVIVLPGRDGELPADLMVGCRAGPVFPIGAIDNITPLSDSDPGGVAEAIEPFLEGEEGQFWPQEDWLILHRSEDEILLVSPTEDSGIAFMTVTEDDSGWQWSGAQSGGPCPLYYTVPEGLNTVEWRLDPSALAPGPHSTELAVLLSEMECVSGQEIGERLIGPQIVMTESSVRIAFAASPPEGDAFDCQGNPEQPYVVDLPVQLGSREVVEGHRLGISLEDYLD